MVTASGGYCTVENERGVSSVGLISTRETQFPLSQNANVPSVGLSRVVRCASLDFDLIPRCSKSEANSGRADRFSSQNFVTACMGSTTHFDLVPTDNRLLHGKFGSDLRIT